MEKLFSIEMLVHENNKWFARLRAKDGERKHTGDLYGWDGLNFGELRQKMWDDFKIRFVNISEWKMIDKTTHREFYVQ